MRFFIVVALVMTACTTPARAPAQAAGVPTLSPEPAAGVPTLSPEPSAQPLATDIPSASAPATAVPSASGPVRNDGNAIVAVLDGIQGSRQLFFGESGAVPEVTLGASYGLSGASLDDANIWCTETVTQGEQPTVCRTVRILPRERLSNGARYTLTYLGSTVGSFTATGIETVTPHVVEVSATQKSLLVRFDRPMSHAGDCGATYDTRFLVPGTLDNIRAEAGTFPPPLGGYETDSATYATALGFMNYASIADDCTWIRFESHWGAAPGEFELSISGIEDADGNPVAPASFGISIVDEGPPTLIGVMVRRSGDTVIVVAEFSEAMDEGTATDRARYRISGRALPAAATLSCEFAGCMWTALAIPVGFFTYGQEETLTVTGVTDTVGNPLVAGSATSKPFRPPL